MIPKFTIRKNTIEVQNFDNEYDVVHRNSVVCIKYAQDYKSLNYTVWIFLIQEIGGVDNERKWLTIHECKDYLPILKWYDKEPITPPKTTESTIRGAKKNVVKRAIRTVKTL